MDRSELKSVLRALAKVFKITILIIIILIIILNIIIVMVSITNILQKCSRSSSRSPSCPSPYDQLSTNPCRYWYSSHHHQHLSSPLMVIAVPRWWTEVLKRDWRAIQQVRLPPGPATITHRFTLQEFRGFSSISLKISRNLKPDLGTRLVRCNSNFNRKHIWSQDSVWWHFFPIHQSMWLRKLDTVQIACISCKCQLTTAPIYKCSIRLMAKHISFSAVHGW